MKYCEALDYICTCSTMLDSQYYHQILFLTITLFFVHQYFFIASPLPTRGEAFYPLPDQIQNNRPSAIILKIEYA